MLNSRKYSIFVMLFIPIFLISNLFSANVYAEGSVEFTNTATLTADFDGTHSNTQAIDDSVRLSGDPLDSYTKLLLHCDGTNESTSFIDETGKTITANGTAKISTTQNKFGGSSAYFDGNGDYISLADSDDWDFGASNFTIDMWVYRTSSGETTLISQRTSDTYCPFSIGFNSADKVITYLSFNNTSWVETPTTFLSTTSIVQNTWFHIAFVRNGSTFTLYINGIAEDSYTNTSSFTNTASPLLIGGYDGSVNDFSGYLDEIRISKGIARWISNFTPPALQYGGYSASGTYTDSEIDISSAGVANQATISHNKTTLANTTLSVEVRTYNGTTWSDWTAKNSGDSIIPDGTDLTGYKVQWRAGHATSDTLITPSLDDVTITNMATTTPPGVTTFTDSATLTADFNGTHSDTQASNDSVILDGSSITTNCTLVATATVPASYGWMEWDVTEHVIEAIDKGTSQVDFLIKFINETLSTGYSGIQFNDRHNTSNYPVLIFAADGRLIGIKDRFDNTIVFHHQGFPVTNLAPNNDFAFAESQGIWSLTGGYAYDLTTGAGKDDNSCLKFNAATATTSSSYSEYIEVTPATEYILKGYLKNQLSSGTVKLAFREYDHNQYEIQRATPLAATQNNTWEPVSTTFTTSPTTKYLRIEYINENAVGTSRLDKVRLDRMWPLITEITDSIGREITFSYNDTLYEGGTGEDGGTITVTVNDPAQTKSLTYTYTRGKFNVTHNWGSWQEARKYPSLYLFNDGEKDTVYNYIVNDERFSYISFNDTDQGAICQNSKRPLLTEVWLRNSKIKYSYQKTRKHLGLYGFYDTHRISERYEQAETGTGFTGQYYRQAYTYSGIYGGTTYDNETGYPYEYNLFENSSYQFTSTMQQANGLKVEQTFKGKYQYKNINSKSASEKITTTYETYDSRFPEQPTLVKTQKENAEGIQTLYKGYTYNDWGGLETETRELTQEQRSDPATKESHTTTYTYDPDYKFPSAQEWYQSAGVKLEQTYTYDHLGRLVSALSPKWERTEYLYEDAAHPGNLTCTNLYHADGSITTTSQEYDANYGAFAVTQTQHYTEDGLAKTSQTHSTYEFLWGNVLTTEDALGNVAAYEYDNLGRVTKITGPASTGETGEFVVEQHYSYEDHILPANNRAVFKVSGQKFMIPEGQTAGTEFQQENAFYDDHGNLLLQQYYDYERSAYINKGYGYNAYGQLTTVKDHNNKQTGYEYDAWNRVLRVTDPNGNKQEFVYDSYHRTKHKGGQLSPGRRGCAAHRILLRQHQPFGNPEKHQERHGYLPV